jgi:hypothetical protein
MDANRELEITNYRIRSKGLPMTGSPFLCGWLLQF